MSTAIAAMLVALTTTSVADTGVDWSRGVISAEGFAIADRSAPSAKVARIRACRLAGDRARAAMSKQYGSIKWASGGTLADKISRLKSAARERLDGLVRERTLRYASDGSCRVESRIPMEALRVAIDGADKPTPVRHIVVRSKSIERALGWRVAVDGSTHKAAVYFTKKARSEKLSRVMRVDKKRGVIEVAVGDSPPSSARVVLWVVR